MPSDAEDPTRLDAGIPSTGQAMRAEGSSPDPETASQALPVSGEGSETPTEPENEEGAKPKRKFGSLSPQEAGRLSAQRRAERALRNEATVAETSSGKVQLVRTPVPVGDIIARLSADAKKGNPTAARELREWMREYPAEDETDLSALDRRTRQQVVARLLAEIAEDEGALPAGPEE